MYPHHCTKNYDFSENMFRRAIWPPGGMGLTSKSKMVAIKHKKMRNVLYMFCNDNFTNVSISILSGLSLKIPPREQESLSYKPPVLPLYKRRFYWSLTYTQTDKSGCLIFLTITIMLHKIHRDNDTGSRYRYWYQYTGIPVKH